MNILLLPLTTALMSLITLCFSAQVSLSDLHCIHPDPEKSYFVPQDVAQVGILSYCAQLRKIQDPYHIDITSRGFAQFGIYWYKAGYGVKNDTRFWMSSSAGLGEVDIDEETCNKGLLTILNGCAPFTIEPGKPRLYKYGGTIRANGKDGSAVLELLGVPVSRDDCLKHKYDEKWCGKADGSDVKSYPVKRPGPKD